MSNDFDSSSRIDRLPAPVGCLVSACVIVSMAAVFFGSCWLASRVLQKPLITILYGEQAYADGLRVVGRQGQLSDGRRLPSGWHMAYAVATFVLSAPIWLGYFVILAWLGLFPPHRQSDDRRWRPGGPRPNASSHPKK